MRDQEVLDELVARVAARTRRNVTLDDVYGRVVASNTSRPTTDRGRIDSVMMKVVPDEVRAWEAESGAAGSRRPFLQPANSERGLLARLCIPLVFRGVRVGYFWVLAADENDDLTELHAQIARDQDGVDGLAERVAGVLQGEDEDAGRRDRAIREAIRGTRTVTAEELGLTPGAPVVVIAAALAALADAPSASARFLAMNAACDALRAMSVSAAVVAEPDHVVVVAAASVDPAAMVAAFDAAAHHRRPHTNRGRRSVGEFGVSQAFALPGTLATAYGQSVLSLQACAVDPTLPGHSFDDAGVYQFAAGPLRRPGAQTLLDRLIESPGGGDLADLLERVYDSGSSMQTLADDLHLHRTTLYNRLQRIQRIIGEDPLAPRTRLQLHVALKLNRWARRPRFAQHDLWLAR